MPRIGKIKKMSSRFGLRRSGSCCHNYQVPDSYINQIRRNASYTQETNDDNGSLDDILYELKEN